MANEELPKPEGMSAGLNGMMLRQADEKRFFGDHEMSKAGLYLPREINDLYNNIVSENYDPVEKAAREERLNQKMGALYSLMYSMYASSAQWGSSEKTYETPTFRLLREVYAKSQVDRLIVHARMRQMRHVSKRLMVKGREKGWYVNHVRAKDADFKVTEDIKRRCIEVENMLMSPNVEAHPTGLRDVFVKMVQGELIVDRKALIVSQRRRDGKPMSWHMLPPDNIKPRFQVILRYMMDNGLGSPADAIAHIRGNYAIDLEDKAFIQEIDNRVLGAWTGDECYIDIVNPSDEINRQGFGVSALEMSLDASTMLMLGMQYNKNIFLSNYPEAFLVLKGEFSPAGLQAFKNVIYQEVGPQGNQRLPIIPTGNANYEAELLRLRDTMTDMQFVQLIRLAICLKCAAYGMHPSTLNFATDLNESGSGNMIVDQGTQEAEIASASEAGFNDIIQNTVEYFGRSLIRPWYDDLAMFFSVEDQPTETQRIDIWTKKLAMGHTVDEYRHAEGDKPLLEATDGAVSGKFLNSPFFFQQQEAEMMVQQQQAQQQMEQQRGDDTGFTGGTDSQARDQKVANTKVVLGKKPTKPAAKPKPKVK